jgi:hypothetical protein
VKSLQRTYFCCVTWFANSVHDVHISSLLCSYHKTSQVIILRTQSRRVLSDIFTKLNVVLYKIFVSFVLRYRSFIFPFFSYFHIYLFIFTFFVYFSLFLPNHVIRFSVLHSDFIISSSIWYLHWETILWAKWIMYFFFYNYIYLKAKSRKLYYFNVII